MASKAIGFLNFKFSADLTSFERAMNKAQKKLKKFGTQLQKTGKNMTMGLTLPIVGLGVASIKAFDAQQKAIAQVEAGLKSTGNQVGFTSEKLQQMAAELQKTTLFGDEEILQGATAQLLTFTNIAGAQFERTQKVALDLATRLDGDLKSASIMLGKALNDPVANLSALSRAGIQFSEDQKSTIKSLVETNQLADAQTIILAELEKQYGGSAEAAALAGTGPLKQMQNRLSDISEEIGMRLIPYIQDFLKWIEGMANKFDGLTESQKDNIVKWGLVLAAIGPVLIIIGKMSVGIGALIGGFKKLSKWIVKNPYLALAAAVALTVVAFTDLLGNLWGVSKAQQAVNDINETAARAISDQKTEVAVLTTILKDENSTLEDKEKALKKLNKISPEYYGKLNAASLDVIALDMATKNYTASILQQAKAEAAKSKLQELNAQLLELKLNPVYAAGTNITSLYTKSINKQIDAVMGMVVANEKLKDSPGNADNQTQAINNLSAAHEKLTGNIQTTVDHISPTDSDFDGLIKPIEAATLATQELVYEAEKISEMAPVVSKAIDDMFPDGPLSEFSGELGRLGEELNFLGFGTIPVLEEALGSMVTTLGDNLAQGAESFAEYGKNVKGILREIIGGLISKGVTAAVSNAMEGMAAFPGSAFLIPIIAGAAAGLARTAFNSLVPEFEQGGIVTGPTTALIGEGVGTSMANPEVVAPLDKLRSMMGGSQNVTVTGRLVGNDIYLSNERTKFNRNRTV